MTVTYQQFIRAKISKKKFRQIFRSFALDFTATEIAQLSKVKISTNSTAQKAIRRKFEG